MIIYINENEKNNLYEIGQSILESFCNDSDFEISPEQINELCYSIKSSSIFNEDYIYTYFNESTINPSGILDKLGIKNAKPKIDKAGKDIANTIKTQGISKKSRAQIHNIVADLFKDLADSISKTSIYDNGKLKDIDKPKLISSLTLLLWVVIVNSLCNVILTIMFGPQLGMALTAIIVAPIVEEAGKQIALKGKFDKEYFIVFNVFEASKYISDLTMAGLPFAKALRARIFAAGMHGVNTIIHKMFDSEEFRKKFNIDNDDKKDKATFASYIISMIVHGTWNTLACVSKTFNKIIIGIDI